MNRATLLNDFSSFLSFLDTLSWNYRLDLNTCIEIWEQSPDTKACETEQFWRDRYGYTLLSDAKGIQTKNRGILYDVSQLDGTEQFKMWKFKRIFAQVFGAFLAHFMELKISLQENFIDDMRQLIQASISTAQESMRTLLLESLCYVIAKRFGIQADKLAKMSEMENEFASGCQMATPEKFMELLHIATRKLLFAAQRAEMYLENFNRKQIDHFAPGWYEELLELRRQSKGPISFLQAMRDIYGTYRQQGDTLFLPTWVIRGNVKWSWERIAYTIDGIEYGRILDRNKLPKWQSPEKPLTEKEIQAILFSGELFDGEKEEISKAFKENKVQTLRESYHNGSIREFFHGTKGYCWLNEDGVYIFWPGHRHCLIKWERVIKRFESMESQVA